MAAALKAAETEEIMGEENNTDFLEKLWQKIKPRLGKPKPNSAKIEHEIQSWSTNKDLNGKFLFKSMEQLSTERFVTFVEELQDRSHMNEDAKKSMLDALDCERSGERLELLDFIDDKGYIYRGWYITVMHEKRYG